MKASTASRQVARNGLTLIARHGPVRQRCVGVAISRCRVLDTSSAAAGEHTLQFPFRRCYSYRILFEEPKRPTDALSSYIRTCLSASYTNREDPRLHGHSNFHLAFLGSGGGNPSTRRVSCGTLLHLGGTSYLFDAGEGMQRQIMFSQFQFYQISKIFITHLHGDHIFGLVGLLLQLSLTGKNMEKQLTVEVYGPPGIYNFIAANIALSVSTLRPKYIHIKVHELFGGSESGHSRGDKGQRSIFSSHYPEISNQCISRKRIDRGSDGTWIIQEFDRDNFANSARRRSLRIVAAELQHLRGIQTFGFVVQEEEPLRTIDAQKAIKLGVKPSRKYQQLKQGLSVETDDGLRQVRPEDVLLGETKKARKVAVLGDTCHVPPEMMQLCQDVDVLVHEATIPCDSTAAIGRGHSTGGMAGSMAKSVNARVLVLNHISSGRGDDDLETLMAQARASNDDVSEISLSYDFMELCVPREGFSFGTNAKRGNCSKADENDRPDFDESGYDSGVLQVVKRFIAKLLR